MDAKTKCYYSSSVYEQMATQTSTLTSKRNVLVVGKTGGGKSTIANRILTSIEETEQPFIVSSDVLSSTECETIMKSGILYTGKGTFNVNVIDTIGLFDTRGTLSNKLALSKMRQFFRSQVSEGIHLIIFTFKVGRWTQQEEEVMLEIVKNFKEDVSDVSALVFTACEQYNQAKRDSIVNDFQSKPKFKHVAEMMKRGIHTVGFPDFSEMDEHISQIYEPGVKADQEKLRQLVYEDLPPRLATQFQAVEETSFWSKVKDSCVIL